MSKLPVEFNLWKKFNEFQKCNDELNRVKNTEFLNGSRNDRSF